MYRNNVPSYEKCAQEKVKYLPYSGYSVDAAIFSRAVENQTWPVPISALWDQDHYLGDNPSDTWDNDLGLAEFTNANFFSQNTSPGKYNYPDPYSVANIFVVVAEDGEEESVYYIEHPEEGYRLATLCFTAEDGDTEIKYGQDDNVWQDYAGKLIPRAVGYSAALLKYFFRGSLEISTPNNFVYGIIDGSGPHEFTQVKAKVRNTTPNGAVQAGTLIAVAKYRKRIDYQEGLYTDPPLEWSREKNWSFSVSEDIEISTLSSDIAQEFTFNFSDDPIPVGTTDLYLQVVFKGTLGNEKDIAVAVGMKDLTEPTHICTWNSTDRVYINDESLTGSLYGVLRTQCHKVNGKACNSCSIRVY